MSLKAVVAFEEGDGFGPQVQKVMDAINNDLHDVAKRVHKEAKTTAAFVDKTGRLRRSIRLKKSKFPDGGYIVVATGKNKDGSGNHARLVEYGHLEYVNGVATGRRVAPRPFLRTALENGINYAITKVGK